jgi:hypothetical protein
LESKRKGFVSYTGSQKRSLKSGVVKMRNNRDIEGGQLNEYCWEQDQGGHFKNKITMTPARAFTRIPDAPLLGLEQEMPSVPANLTVRGKSIAYMVSVGLK